MVKYIGKQEEKWKKYTIMYRLYTSSYTSSYPTPSTLYRRKNACKTSPSCLLFSSPPLSKDDFRGKIDWNRLRDVWIGWFTWWHTDNRLLLPLRPDGIDDWENVQAPKVSLLLQEKNKNSEISKSSFTFDHDGWSMGHFLLTVVFDRERSDRNVDDGGNIRGCC